MRVRLTYTGYLRLPGVESGSCVDVAEGTTLGDLLDGFDVARTQQRFLRLFANERQVDPSYVLRDGDEVTVIIQIAGG